MKQEIAAFELNYIINELQGIVGAKVDKIFQPEKKEVTFQLYAGNSGKKLLRIIPGKFMYMTQFKGENPQAPFGYCLFLRKHLDSARITGISQIAFERIVEIAFEKKDKKYKFIAEFFDKGNLIVCDENYKIISPLEIQKWEKRTIMAGKIYTAPQKEYNFLKITKTELKKILESTSHESVVKCMAIDLGLGGVYSEELCVMSKIDKMAKPKSVDISKLFSALESLRSAKPDAYIIKDKDNIKDIVPIKLGTYGNFDNIKKESYNEALDSVLTDVKMTLAKQSVEKEHTTNLSKTQKLIGIQKKQLEDMEKEYLENQKIGEAIFENYGMIKDILDQITLARKTLSYDEIKKRLKAHKIVKNIDEK